MLRRPQRGVFPARGGTAIPWAMISLFCLLVLFPCEAFAQYVIGKPERLIVTPSMGITGKYDTNINQDPSDEIEDYSTIYSPAGSVVYRLANTILSGEYAWSFEEFDDLEELNNLDQSGSGSVSHVFGPHLSFTGGVSYSKAEEEDVDLDLTVRGRLAESARERQSSESIGANASIWLGYLPRLPVTLTYGFSDATASARDEPDTLTHAFGADASYLIAPERGHRLDFSYTALIREENRNTTRAPADPLLNFAANDLTEHTATAAYTHRFDPTFSATAGGGPSIVSHSDDPSMEGDIDPVLFAGLTKRWTRTGASLNWALDTGRGGGFEGTTTTQTVGLVADHSPLPNLGLAVSVNYGDSSEENRATALDTDEERFSVSPSISYLFLRYFSLSGGYSYSRIEGDENFTDSEFQGFDASLSLVLRPDLPQLSVNYSYSHNDSEADEDDFERELLLFTISYSLALGL